MPSDEHVEPIGPEIQPNVPPSGKQGKANGAAPLEEPDIDELPEEPEQPSPVNPAAGAEKFARFGRMRRDPKAELIPTRKRLVAIPARTPSKNWFVRSSTNSKHQGVLPLFWDKDGDGKPYLVDEDCIDFFDIGAVRNNYCTLSITRQKTLFLWCGPLEAPDGDWNSWHASAHDMKLLAANSWIRIVANKQLAGYDVIEPEKERNVSTTLIHPGSSFRLGTAGLGSVS
jgi:hypothetical protein